MGGIVGSVVGAVLGGNAAKSAAKTQASAANKATALEKEQFEYLKEISKPFVEQGTNALKRYSDMVVGGKQDLFMESPGYKFRFDQGRKAIENSAVARGVGTSGNTMQALTEYGQGVASQEYGTYLDQLLSLMGYGQTGVAQSAAASQGYASRAGENMMAAGTARASGIIGQANAINAGINDFSRWSGYGLGGNSGYGTPGTFPGSFNQTAYSSGLPWSDRALKTDIKLVGKENGINVYEFRYRHQPDALWRGVIAQEVQEIAPDAVANVEGYLAVDYQKIGIEFMRAV